MSIWNKVLTGLIIVTSLMFFYLAARVFRTHAAWRTSIATHEAAIATTSAERETLVEGDPSSPGVRQRHIDLQRLTAARGRVWKNVMHGDPEAATGKVRVTPQQPNAQAVIPVGTQIFLFRQASERDSGAYLGDFKVGAVNDKEWELQPTRTMIDVTRMRESRGPWVLYEKMPLPHPDFLAESGGDQPAGAAPAAAAPPAPPAEDAKAVVDRYAGRMINYQRLFDDYYSWRAAMTDTLEALRDDNKAMETAIQLAQKEAQQLEAEKKAFNAELQEVTRHRNEIASHLDAVQAKLAQVEAAVADARKRNQFYAAEIARLQLDAIRRIDERTRGVGTPITTY
jgi:hypothetical protein